MTGGVASSGIIAMQILLATGHPLELRPRSLCLEFANTVGDHASDNPREYLKTYADLAQWAARAGALGEAEAARLTGIAARRPAAAKTVLRRAVGLREAIYRTMTAQLRGNLPDLRDVEIINAELAGAMGGLRLRLGAQGHALGWPEADMALDAMLRPVAVSAADLLTTPDLLARVGQCADADGCGWLFLDFTKNRSRRWCAMRDCGNRAKAKRFYRKQRRPPVGNGDTDARKRA